MQSSLLSFAVPAHTLCRDVCCPAAKEWFCNLTVCHPDWSIAECIRYAQRLAPELFQVHIQTPRKWLRSGLTHVRPAVLGPAHVTELVDLGQRISEGIACGSSVFRFAFNQRLEALGCTYRFGPRDCRRFLRQLDLKWRQPAGEKKKWSDSDVRENRGLTARKLVWTLNDAGAHPSRLCNIDETATKLLPIGEKGWLRPGAAPVGNKAYITTVLATRYGSPDLLAQCIFQGKTRACEPTHAFSTILTSHTESHWSSNATLVDFVEFIDKTWFNPQEPPHTDTWVLLWDVCTTHASRETLAELRSRLPHVRVTFLPPGSTSHTQPCDISYMRALKAGLARAAAKHLVSSLIMDPDAAIVLKHSSMELKSMFLAWLHTTLAEISTETHNVAAWKHILPRAGEWDSVLAAAQRDHAGGSLFTPHRRRPAPELLHIGAAEHDIAMGSSFIEEDVVDEDPDEEQLADEHFFVDELEDSMPADGPSELETVDAEPLPSAPADPVQILTRLQALRIVYGKCAPK